jgi:hypothetical protein
VNLEIGSSVYHPAQASRESSPEPTTGGQQRRIAALGDSLMKNRGIWNWLGRDRSRRLALVANIDQNDGQQPIADRTEREAA